MFWDIKQSSLTPQGIECCDLLKDSNKLFGIVRMNKLNGLRQVDEFEQTIRKSYGFKVIWVTAAESFKWGKRGDWSKYVLERQEENPNLKILLVICQTATRSTEIKFHKHICFWHDNERKNSNYNTIMQAAGRVFYYDSPTNNPTANPVDIIVYSSIIDFKLNAKLITLAEYSEGNKKISGRVKSGKKWKEGAYTIKHEILDHEPTLDEYILLAKKHNGRTDKKGIQVHKCSKRKDDLAKLVLQDAAGNPSRRVGWASVVHFDSPIVFDTWEKYVMKRPGGSLVGKFLLIIEVPTGQFTSEPYVTAGSSMYNK